MTDFSGDAAKLFNNMKTPASILGGSMIALGVTGVLPTSNKPENSFFKLLRQLNLVVAVLSYGSQILAIIYASMAANNLTENKFEPTETVFHLLQRDFALSWTAVNSHFLFGMIGSMWLIGTRALFLTRAHNFNKYFGAAACTTTIATLSLMLATVNRQIENGLGQGNNALALFKTYNRLLIEQAFSKNSFGVCEAIGILLFLLVFIFIVLGISSEVSKSEKNDKDKTE